MYYGKVLVTLVFLGLVFIGCSKSGSSKPDMRQFITRESLSSEFLACEGSANLHGCITRPAIRKVEKYCSDNKMSDSQCKELMNAVMDEVSTLTEMRSNAFREATDRMNEATEQERRKPPK